jgi:uncharacterized protein
MDTLVDTGFAYAVANPLEKKHKEALAFYVSIRESLLFPSVALPEVAFLAKRDGGNLGVIAVLKAIHQSRLQIVDVDGADHSRAIAILEKYHDSRIDFVDACIMAMAERLSITRILTFDHRDFGMYRPSHAERFDLLP